MTKICTLRLNTCGKPPNFLHRSWRCNLKEGHRGNHSSNGKRDFPGPEDVFIPGVWPEYWRVTDTVEELRWATGLDGSAITMVNHMIENLEDQQGLTARYWHALLERHGHGDV